MLGATDDEQLAAIVREGRVMITQDTDFLRLHAAARDHPGIIFYAAGARSVGDVIRGARLVWELLEPAEMANQVEYV